MSAGDNLMVPVNSHDNPPVTESLAFYEDHRELIEALVKKAEDIKFGHDLYKKIYFQLLMNDPMEAMLKFQQELLPVKQDITNQDMAAYAHKLDMATDLSHCVTMAESLFNKGDKITASQADHLAGLLLFLSAIPFPDDLNSQVVKSVQSSMQDMITTVFKGKTTDARSKLAQEILTELPKIFDDYDPGHMDTNDSFKRMKAARDDMDNATSMLSACSKALQNDAKTATNDQETQVAGYSKMANMQTGFERSSNKNIH